jgi:hypothetical protein
MFLTLNFLYCNAILSIYYSYLYDRKNNITLLTKLILWYNIFMIYKTYYHTGLIFFILYYYIFESKHVETILYTILCYYKELISVYLNLKI